jgi:hypothetical protein
MVLGARELELAFGFSFTSAWIRFGALIGKTLVVQASDEDSEWDFLSNTVLLAYCE